jgi:hypothetical protein
VRPAAEYADRFRFSPEKNEEKDQLLEVLSAKHFVCRGSKL